MSDDESKGSLFGFIHSDEQVKECKSKRAYIRKLFTQRSNIISQSNFAELSVEEVKTHLAYLKDQRKKLVDLDELIGPYILDNKEESVFQKEIEDVAKYDSKYFEICDKLKGALSREPRGDAPVQRSTGSAMGQNPTLKMPILPLPRYSHRDGDSFYATHF